MGSRYSGRNFLRCIPEDIEFFKRLAGRSGGARFRYLPQVDKVDVRKTQFAATTGVSTAFYCMMLGRRPVSIMDDGLNDIPLDRYSTKANRKDRHHIFPRALLSGVDISPSLYNSICNICLLTAEENQTIGSRCPHMYFGSARDEHGYFARKMKRHLIPSGPDSGIWQTDVRRGYKWFLREREEMICRALEEEAGTRLFRRDS